MKLFIYGKSQFEKTLTTDPIRRGKLTPLGGSNHIPTSPMLLVRNSVLCIIDLHLMTGSISVRRRGVGLSDYSSLSSFFSFTA